MGFCSLSLSAAPRRPPATKISRPAAQHPFWTGLRRRRQKAEQADRGLGLRLSSGYSSATKISRPAAQHPLWAGLRRRRQKAEQWGRGRCGAAPAFGADLRRKRQENGSGTRSLARLGFCSLYLSAALVARRPPATKFSRPAAQHPFWTGLRHRRQKAEQADRGLVSSPPQPAWGSALSPFFSRPLVRHRPPNFLGLRRSTNFGLACGAEGRGYS